MTYEQKLQIAWMMSMSISLENEVEIAKAEADNLKRQLLFTSSLCAATATADCPGTVQRERWCFDRNERWFEDTLPHLAERFFRQSCRVSPSTFRYIVESCRPLLQREDTVMRPVISVEKRVAVSLYKLCSSTEDRSIANLFALGRSTVNTLYREFCDVVVELLEDKWVTMPTADHLADHITAFNAVCDFPQAVGALDGCHFPVSLAKEFAVDYYNYKGW
ncbi:uncharacterized protein LOC144153324 [Haemaphysalis longicornis]